MSSLNEKSWMQTLYTFDNNEKLRMWQCWVKGDILYTKQGLVFKKDGTRAKLRISKKIIKVNNRSKTAEEAAEAKADQEWRKRIRKGTYKPYHCVPDMNKEQWLLLHNDDRKWPAVCMDWVNSSDADKKTDEENYWLGQPKIDGDRCTIWIKNGKVHLYSRTCLDMNYKQNIRCQAINIFKKVDILMGGNGKEQKQYDFGLDGEIWSPKEDHHQNSRSITSRSVNIHEDEDSLMFAWFDIMDYTRTFEERVNIIQTVKNQITVEDNVSNIYIVPFKKLTSIDDIYNYRSYANDIGFDEGIVIRRPDLMYASNGKIKNRKEWKHGRMLKFKIFEDAEFEVIGFKQAEGSDREGCIVWELKCPQYNITFTSQQKGDINWQRELFDNGHMYIGKLLTVRFMNRTADHIPYQPRVLKFRADEDLALKND